jgi:hypothetical protein
MLPRGPIRVKQPLEAGGRGQTVVSKPRELETLLERLAKGDIAATGLVLEENLERVTTLSDGHISRYKVLLFWKTKAYDRQQRAISLRRVRLDLCTGRMGQSRAVANEQ